jgi:predicted nucleic acid-binding protein
MRKHHLSAYDAAYLEIALRYNIPLISLDADLSKAAKIEGISTQLPVIA